MKAKLKEAIPYILLIVLVWTVLTIFCNVRRKADYQAIDASPIVRVNAQGQVEVRKGATVEQYKQCITELANEIVRMNKIKQEVKK